jgi:TRAP-type C4-dicarboxylate transport system substrate-binding protein
MERSFKVFSSLALGSAILLSAGSASAETMKITYVAAPPPAQLLLRLSNSYYIPTINKRLAAGGDFKIQWTKAWGSSLASFKDTFEAVEDGIAQMGMTLNVFEQSNLPLENLSYKVPFATDKPFLLNKVHRSLHKKFPEMDKAWTSRNQVYLGGSASDTWNLITKFPVTKYEDLKGRRIGASGAASAWVRAVGGVPVTSSMNQSFTNIKNGLYDGYPISVTLAFIYKTYEAAKHMTKVNFGATVGPSISFNKQAWDKIPAYAQKIIREETTTLLNKYSGASLALEKKFSGIMMKKGLKIAAFPESERRRWAMKLPNVPKVWAEKWEKKGMPAKKILQAYLDGLRAGGQKLARNWDKE